MSTANLTPKPVDGRTDPCPTPGYGGRHTAVGAGAINSPYRCHGCGVWFAIPDTPTTLPTPRPERVTLADEEREALTCDCGVMEDDPTWPETFCPFHSGRMNLEISGSADALESIVENILAARERALREEIARLTRWKEEALPVLDGLQDLGKALGLPLGERITGPAALAAAKRLTARGETR